MRYLMLLAVAALAAAPLEAQERSGILRGLISADSNMPLEGASIEMLGTKFRHTTTAAGTYRFVAVPAGRYWILVRRIGYAPVRISATVESGSDRDLPITLERLPAKLDELTVLADLGMSRHRFIDFQFRSKAAFGTFLTRDDLAASSGDVIAVAQRYLPGRTRFTLEQRGDYSRDGILRRRGGYFITTSLSNRDCAPAISINGSSPFPGISLADFDKSEIEAMEIYRRGSWVPTEFSFRNDFTCGLVVVWLR